MSDARIDALEDFILNDPDSVKLMTARETAYFNAFIEAGKETAKRSGVEYVAPTADQIVAWKASYRASLPKLHAAVLKKAVAAPKEK